MLRTPVAEALGAASAVPEIRIGGWVRTRRDAKGFSFLELNDGSCLGNIQCIVDEAPPHGRSWKASTRARASPLTGELVESPGKGQKWEVRAKDMTVFGLADPETFPLQKKRHSDEFLRTIAHLRFPYQQIRGGLPHPCRSRARRARLFLSERVLLCAYAHPDGIRLRRCGRNVPGDDPAPERPREARRKPLCAGLFRQGMQLDRFRPA